MSAEQRSARATLAGNTVLQRYGQGYFEAMGRQSRKAGAANETRSRRTEAE